MSGDRRHHALKRSAFVALLLPFLLALPASASADWFVAPFIGLKFASETNILDLEQGANNTKMTLGVAVAVLGDKMLGIEGELGYSPRFFERSTGSLVAGSNVTTVMGNVIIAVPKTITRDSLRPYAVAGAGLIHVGIDDVANVLPVKSNLAGISIGGGAIGRLTSRTSARFEVRHIRSIGSQSDVRFLGTHIAFWRATVGIALMGTLF